MNRETISVTTPGGSVIVLNSYVTGREKRAITNVFFQKELSDGAQYNQAEDLALKTVIVSIDGKKEGDQIDGKPYSIVDAVLSMKASESKFVLQEVNKVSSEKATEEKKTS